MQQRPRGAIHRTQTVAHPPEGATLMSFADVRAAVLVIEGAPPALIALSVAGAKGGQP